MSDDADDKERAEAEALSRALEPGSDARRGDEADRDALETAALLRYGGAEGELRRDRADAVLERLMPSVDAVPRTAAQRAGAAAQPRAHARRGVVRYLPAGLGVLAAAAAALLVITSVEDGLLRRNDLTATAHEAPSSASTPQSPAGAAGGPEPGTLPAPTQRLLATQAALAGDRGARDRAAFDAEMRAYREQVLRALERAYPARLGMLAPGGGR